MARPVIVLKNSSFDKVRPHASAVLLIVICLALMVAGCASRGPYQISLMPAPEIYATGKIDPFEDTRLIETAPEFPLLFATDRMPATEEEKEMYYLNERGHLLRFGKADVELAGEVITWEEARRISLLKDREGKYPLQVKAVQEIGVLYESISVLDDIDEASPPPDAGAGFARLINRKLKDSIHKDIFIYVHGFKVVFENPLLVASELWHFLGYDGVFIAYSWPSTPSVFAYMSDIETAAYTSRNLRLLLEFLARQTDVRKVHIIGYSAGARVVSSALYQLALLHKGRDRQQVLNDLRIGHVIMAGSDVDRDIFAGIVLDGVMNVPETLNVYLSKTDQALGFSAWFFGRKRMGQMIRPEDIRPSAEAFLKEHPFIRLIDVTGAESADHANGHAYFRDSPWVSSDILVTLLTGLAPAERGLVPKGAGWQFPDDYLTRLNAALESRRTSGR